jgi:UDP-glucose 4-epimerase
VKDVVKANLLAAVTPEASGDVFNCASGIKVTIQELAEKVAAVLGVKAQINYGEWTPGDIKVFEIDNSKIAKTFGINFLTDFDEGLKLTVDWAVNYFKRQEANV